MLSDILLSTITPNPQNPRTRFEGPKFDELVASIRSSGLLEPIIVRPKGEGYELVAGERRFRATLKVHDGNDQATIPKTQEGGPPCTHFLS